MLKTILCLSGLVLLGACSQPDPPPPKKTFLDPMLQTEQRARDVQKTLDDSSARQAKSVDSQERGDSAP